MTNAKVGRFTYNSTWPLTEPFDRLRRRVQRTSVFQSFRQHLHISPPPIKQPIFIVGAVRSGKTTLAKCLGQHPRIMYLGYELTSEWCDLADIEIARTHNNRAHCPPYMEWEATTTRCDKVRNGFAELLARNGGNRNTRFFDENPHLWNKLPFLRKIFPDAKLIITSRDLRSTIASMKLLWMNGNRRAGKNYYFPRNPEYCWSVIPPASPDERESARVFPGGDVVVLAEYWLHVYEMIERTIEGFDSPILIKHREFVNHPYETLPKIYDTLALPSVNSPLPEKLDTSCNDRWSKILTSEEQKELQAFIDTNGSRIERLRYADTTL